MARRKKNQGRRYQIDEALEFWFDGYAEGMGAEGAEVTPEVRKEWEKFGNAVERSMEKHLSQAKFEEIYDSEGEDSVVSDVYATVSGTGIGVWDGRWDGYLSQAKIEKLQKQLYKDLSKYADDSGSGSLDEAFADAVYRTGNPAACRRGQLKIRRKGYTRKVGGKQVRVKPVTYCTPDKGKPGRGPKLIPKLKKGTLGIHYSKEPSAQTRRTKLKACVKKYGYASCVGKVNALRVLNKNTWPKKWLVMLDSDMKWLQKTYRGKNPTPARKKNNGKTVKNTKKARKSNPSMRSIMAKALK